MSLTIQQAVQICDTFREENHLSKGHIDRRRLSLGQADRKICWKALQLLKKGALADWDAKDPKNKLSQKRVESIIDAIKAEPKNKKQAKTGWYQAPFKWVAKVVHAFAMWFKETFMGRVSIQKLYDSIEVYRRSAENAAKRIEIINEGSESLIAENQRKIKKTAKQRDVILDKDIMEKQELRHVLIEIESLDRDYHVQRKAMEIAHIKGHDKYDKDVVTFKEIVKTVLQKQDDQYQDYFKNLYDIASEESSSEGDVRKEFLVAWDKVADDINALAKPLNEVCRELEGHLNTKEKLEAETKLLKLKFSL